MNARLRMACWALPKGELNVRELVNVEVQVLQLWKPPLNLDCVYTEWTDAVNAARKVMADQARAWRPE